MFNAGLAAPNDHDEMNMSLTDIVLLEIFNYRHSIARLSRGVKLLAFLLNHTCPETGLHRPPAWPSSSNALLEMAVQMN
jgi:hypothetical protein